MPKHKPTDPATIAADLSAEQAVILFIIVAVGIDHAAVGTCCEHAGHGDPWAGR